MNRLCIAGLLLLGAVPLSIGQDTTILAERFLDVSGEGAAFGSVRDQKVKQFDQMLAGNTNLSELTKSDLLRIPGILTGALSWDRISKPLAAAYSQVFSDAELRDLISFYESPLGKKYLAEKPGLEKQKRDIIRRLAAEAAAESANADSKPTEILIPSLSGMQTVTVGNANISAADVLKEMNKWETRTEPGN